MFRGSSGPHNARCASGPCGGSAGGPSWFTSAREPDGSSSGCASLLRGWETPSSALEGAVIPGRVVSVCPLVEDVAPTSSGASSMARRGWDDGNTALLVSTRRDSTQLTAWDGEGRRTRNEATALRVPIGCLTASVRRAGCWACRPRDRYPRLRPPSRMTAPRLCPSPIGASFCLCPVRVADETPAPPLCLVAEVGQGLFSVRPAVVDRPQPGQWESALTTEFAA